MREFQERKRLKRLLYSRMTVGLLAVLILFLGNAAWNMYQKERESAANALAAQNELAKLQERQTVLNAELERLNTDEGIEEEIRSKYSVSKPGENMVIIIDKNEGRDMPVQKKEGWWDRFKKLFK